jgi:hypothetical protein
MDFDTDQRTLVLKIGNSTDLQNRRPCKNHRAVLSDERKKEADEVDSDGRHDGRTLGLSLGSDA